MRIAGREEPPIGRERYRRGAGDAAIDGGRLGEPDGRLPRDGGRGDAAGVRENGAVDGSRRPGQACPGCPAFIERDDRVSCGSDGGLAVSGECDLVGDLVGQPREPASPRAGRTRPCRPFRP